MKHAVARKVPETTISTERAVAIRSVYPSRLHYVGVVSGKEYAWEKASDVVMVDSEDVPTLLEKRIGNRSCCGARQGGNQVFELAESTIQEAQ